MKQYKLTVTENQLRVISTSLESYFRTRMGQFFDLSDDLAFCGFSYSQPHDEKWSEGFDERIARRDECKEKLDEAFKIAQPRLTANDYYGSTPEMVSAIDLWHVIRHQFWKEREDHKSWTVDSYPPSSESGEPLMEIEITEGKNE